MSNFNFEGGIKIEGESHSVEYEPGGQTGLSTIYFRLKGKDNCIPIYIKEINEVIEMLQRGKNAIEAIER